MMCPVVLDGSTAGILEPSYGTTGAGQARWGAATSCGQPVQGDRALQEGEGGQSATSSYSGCVYGLLAGSPVHSSIADRVRPAEPDAVREPDRNPLCTAVCTLRGALSCRHGCY